LGIPKEIIISLRADNNRVCKFGKNQIDRDNLAVVLSIIEDLYDEALQRSELCITLGDTVSSTAEEFRNLVANNGVIRKENQEGALNGQKNVAQLSFEKASEIQMKTISPLALEITFAGHTTSKLRLTESKTKSSGPSIANMNSGGNGVPAKGSTPLTLPANEYRNNASDVRTSDMSSTDNDNSYLRASRFQSSSNGSSTDRYDSNTPASTPVDSVQGNTHPASSPKHVKHGSGIRQLLRRDKRPKEFISSLLVRFERRVSRPKDSLEVNAARREPAKKEM
jgi:hypothetical protein